MQEDQESQEDSEPQEDDGPQGGNESQGDGELQENSESQEDSEPQKDDESQKGNGPQEDDNPLEDDSDDSRGIEGALSETYTFSEELGNALLTSRVAVRERGTASTFTVKLDIDQRREWRDAFLESLIHDTM